jgi:hypothetical protein
VELVDIDTGGRAKVVSFETGRSNVATFGDKFLADSKQLVF